MPMHNPTPDVFSRYGAPMGRHTGPDYLEVTAGPLYLRRIYLDNGGYDRGGAYWGHARKSSLYYVEDGDGNSQFLRASDRTAAKRQIETDWPGATFYR